MPPVAQMPDLDSHVCSPAGIRLVSGLVAPYLSPAGQGELAERWGDAVDRFAERYSG